MKTILLTGFEPFGGDTRNPSADVASALDESLIKGARVVGRVLPCVIGQSRSELLSLMGRHKPTLVVCLGLAGGRHGLSVERVAINVDDARIADNAGNQPIDRPSWPRCQRKVSRRPSPRRRARSSATMSSTGSCTP